MWLHLVQTKFTWHLGAKAGENLHVICNLTCSDPAPFSCSARCCVLEQGLVHIDQHAVIRAVVVSRVNSTKCMEAISAGIDPQYIHNPDFADIQDICWHSAVVPQSKGPDCPDVSPVRLQLFCQRRQQLLTTRHCPPYPHSIFFLSPSHDSIYSQIIDAPPENRIKHQTTPKPHLGGPHAPQQRNPNPPPIPSRPHTLPPHPWKPSKSSPSSA